MIRAINETVNVYVTVVAKPEDKSVPGRSDYRSDKILKWTPKSKSEFAVRCLCEGRKWYGIP